MALPAPKITAHDGHYESDALLYAAVAEEVLAACLAHTDYFPPLGLCSQRSSFLIWEQRSGQPLTPLISWQDNRGTASCEELKTSENIIRDITGLRLTPYYFAPKLRVLLQQHPAWRERLARGELRVGTLDTFLIWRWSGGHYHVTDPSMAARTLLLDIRQQQWSPQLCDLFGLPLNSLPQLHPSSGLSLRLNNGLTLQASVGDQSAALLASVNEESAQALVNLGTGGFVLRYATAALGGYLRTLVYQDKNLTAHIAVEGTLNSLALALAPYPINDCRLTDLAASDIFCLAEPSGLGAPYFRADIGLCFSDSVEHLTPQQIAALLLEAIIFRVARILEEFHRATPIQQVILSGGLSELSCLQQGIAQCVPFEVLQGQHRDASLQGAAQLAAGRVAHPLIEKIVPAAHDGSLIKKYRLWQVWLDQLLNANY